MPFKNIIFFKFWHIVKNLIQILTPCENFVSEYDALESFHSKSDKFHKFFSEIRFLFWLSGSDWMMTSFFNANTSLFLRGELKDNACYRISRQMDNWKLPHVNSSLNLWGIALSQHAISTGVMDRTLWSIKSSRSALFLKLNVCENKRIGNLVRIPSILSNVFLWTTGRIAMERSWHLHSIYPILAAGRYLPHSWYLSKQTMLDRKSNFETCVSRSIP